MTTIPTKSKTTRVELGTKVFELDEAKAIEALQAKRVINGRATMTFNLLPLKYQWAYEIYRKMKANHWEPEDIPMQRDIEQWRSESALTEIDRYSRQVAELVGQIALSTSREADLASGTAENIQHIFAVTEQTGEGTKSTVQQVRELTRIADELRQSVSRFRIA